MKRQSVIILFLSTLILAVMLSLHATAAGADEAPNPFRSGIAAYEQKDFVLAKKLFTAAVTDTPGAGAYHNLGNAEWQLNHTAEAVIAWERARRLDPCHRAAENNLKFAREMAQLEAPELSWCEIVSGWLTAEAWAWTACGSLWFAIGMMIVPGVLRRRKTATQQAAVALGLGLFLLSLPANYGVWTRTKIGFVMTSGTDLKLTPTKEGEPLTKLSAGEPGRVVRKRGDFLLIRTRRATGWVGRGDFQFVSPE